MFYDILWCIVVMYRILYTCTVHNIMKYLFCILTIILIYLVYTFFILILLVHYNKYLSEYFTCITFPFVVCNFNAVTYMYNNGYPWWFSRKCMTQHKHVTVVGEYFGYLCWSCEMINVYSGSSFMGTPLPHQIYIISELWNMIFISYSYEGIHNVPKKLKKTPWQSTIVGPCKILQIL